MKIKKQIVILVIVISFCTGLFANNRWVLGANIGSMFHSREGISDTDEGGNSKLLDANSSIQNGKVYGMFIGYHQSKNILFSLSYQHFGDYNANFTLFVPEEPIGNNLVKGNVDSQVALLNVDYFLTRLSFKIHNINFTPYIGIGEGIARNEFTNIIQSRQGTVYSTVESHRTTNPAAQARIGINAALTKHINIGLIYEITGVGSLSPGDERTDNNGYKFIIEPYAVNNIIYNTAQLVFSYQF